MNLYVALAPLVILSVGLTLFSLRDLYYRTDAGVKGGSRAIWLVIVLLGSTLGSIVYLTLGRQEAPLSDE